MSDEQHRSPVPHSGRYIRLMRDLARFFEAEASGRPPRILLYRCSSGPEFRDLFKRYPRQKIFACDVDTKALAAARAAHDGAATFFERGSAAMKGAAPFDAVLALNVFCRHPKTAGLDDVSAIYSFASFEVGLHVAERYLSPGGVLGLYNCQYCFEDAALSRSYRPLPEGEEARNGWIEKALPDGRRATDVSYTFEGKTFSRAAWSEWLREGDNRQRAMGDGGERFTYRHAWIDPAAGEGRSTRHCLWINSG